jgi:hypothetical protein
MRDMGGICHRIYCLCYPIYTLTSYLHVQDSVTLDPLIPIVSHLKIGDENTTHGECVQSL